MTRREFAAAVSAAGLFASPRLSGAAFPVRYARANPFDEALRFVEPGSDEYQGEKAAAALTAKLHRIFSRQEPAPAGLRSWVAKWANIRAARFYPLAGGQVRYEIKTLDSEGHHYYSGVWALPDYQSVSQSAVSSGRPYFRDVTGHVFGKAQSFQQQLLKGNPYWRARLDAATGIDVYGNQGIAVGDMDGDGVDEVYVCQPGGLPNRLYKIKPDGTADDITEHAGLGILDDTTCALFADFRNLGKQDLVVLRAQGPLLFLNQGDGTFREQPDAFRFAEKAQGSFTGMAAADYDRDGRLDLYLCCYVYFQSEDQYQFPAPYQDAKNGPPNFLFRNVAEAGGIAFEDVTAPSGMNDNNDRFSFAPAWGDVNGDGWPDLYVANDFGRNNLYRNKEGHFHDAAAQAGVEDMGPGMSASWFDSNGDGRPDLYVSNMWTAAGQRVIKDPAFHPAAGNAEAFRRHTKGNSLYRNKGDGTFEERSNDGAEMGRWAWGSGGFDFDLDGVPEILVATGMVTNGGERDVESFFWRQVVAKTPSVQASAPAYENGWSAINQLIREDYSWSGHEPNVFYVRRDGRYQDASGVSGFDFADDSRAFAVTDFDGDGNLDLLLKSRLGPQIRALQNDSTGGRPAIAFTLRGTKSSFDAIGARVEVNGQVQFLQAGSGFLSQHSKKLHFGLAGKARAQVDVVWPSGQKQVFTNLEPGSCYALVEGSEQPARTAFKLKGLFPEAALIPENRAVFADTWLVEPVPLPEKHDGAGFVLLFDGNAPQLSGSLPIQRIDLSREKEEVAAGYALFRRYLFEYRAGLTLPLLLLVDNRSCARKVYASIPGEAELRADLKKIDQNRALALPFPGVYFSPPRRNYFKLGAAFYWAGYPKLALPYLEETIRANPANWKALLAIARLHEELGQSDQAADAYKRLLSIRVDYADAMDQLGLLAAGKNNLPEARDWFERAIAAQHDHADAINNLGVLFAKMGKRNDSIAAFRYGIEKVPDNEALYLNLGRVYITMDQREQARGVLNQLLQRKPGNALALKALAELEGR